MTDAEDEAKWPIEFERDSERAVRDTIYYGSGIYSDRKRLAAPSWLREQESKRALQEEKKAASETKRVRKILGWTIAGIGAGKEGRSWSEFGWTVDFLRTHQYPSADVDKLQRRDRISLMVLHSLK